MTQSGRKDGDEGLENLQDLVDNSSSNYLEINGKHCDASGHGKGDFVAGQQCSHRLMSSSPSVTSRIPNADINSTSGLNLYADIVRHSAAAIV